MSDDSDSFYRSILKGGGVVFVGKVVEMGVSFLGLALIARFFGRTDYGAVSIGLTVMGFATTLSLIGLNQGIARNLPRYDNVADRRGVLVSSLQMAIPTAVLIGGSIALVAPLMASAVFGDASIAPILRIMGATVPAVAFARLALGAVQGIQLSHGKVIIQNLTIPIVRISLIAVVLLFGFSVIGIAFAYALAYAAAAVVGLYYFYRYTPLFESAGSSRLHRSLLRFSAPLVVSTAMTKVLSDIDTVLLGVSATSTTGDVGIYRAIYPLAALLPFILSSLAFMFLPIISELHSNGREGEMRRMYQIVTKWATFATLPLFFAILFFPRNVIALTFGLKFVEGAFALQVLSFAFFAPLIAGPNSPLLASIGNTKQIMYFDAVTAMINVVLNLLLIPQFSYLGAAAATAVAYIFQNIMYSTQVYRETGIHPITKSLTKPAVASLAVGSGLALAISSIREVSSLMFLLTLAIYTVVHGVLVIALGGIEREEVMLVLSFEERFGIDLGPFKQIANWLM